MTKMRMKPQLNAWRMILLCLLLTAFAFPENLQTNQGGTTITPGDWVDVTSTLTGLNGTTIPYYMTGWDKNMYVPSIDSYCGIGSYYQPSSEPNQNWSCYSFTENRWFMVSMSGLFADEHLQEGGHPMGNVQVDPTTSVALGFQGSSGSQVSNQTKYGMWRYDFSGDVGIPDQPPMGITPGNQLGTTTYDPARMLQIGFGGDSSSQGHYQYDNNRSHSTCTSNGYNCYNSWSLEMGVTLNSLPVSIENESLAENTSDGKVYLFGGFYSAASHSGVWAYAPGTNGAAGTWSNVFPDSTTSSANCHDRLGGTNCPLGRENAGWAYDAADNFFLMTGGAVANTSTGSPQSPLNDTWIFNPSSNTWTQVATSLTAHVLGYEESSHPLSSAMLATDTSFSITSAFAYSVTASAVQTAIFQIDSEFIACTGQTGQTTFSSCTRGYENTTPAAHSSAAAVYNNAPLSATNERLAWIPEHNVFMMFTKPIYSTAPALSHMFLFAYAPTENAGHYSRSYSYTAPTSATVGPLNRNTVDAADQAWAYGNTVASDGTNLFIGHTETATKQVGASPSNSYLLHPYVQKLGGSSACGTLDSGYTCLGSSYSSISPDLNSNPTNSFQISCAVVSSNPWCYWYQTDTSISGMGGGSTGGGGTSLATVALGTGWNGTSWGLGGQIPNHSSLPGSARKGPGQMIAVGTTPTVIEMEQDHSGSISGNQNPYAMWCYVDQWNGSAWAVVGGAALNSGYSMCETPSVATDGTNLWAAFTYRSTYFAGAAGYNGTWIGPPQVQLWYWNGSTWAQQGASGNVSGTSCTGLMTGTAPPTPVGSGCSRAFNTSVTVLGGVPYVAWVERTDQQTTQKLVIRKFSSGTWSTVVSDLRRDQNAGWAFRPELTNDGTDLYVTWDEQGNDQPYLSGLVLNTSRGQKDKVYAAKVTTGGTVTYLGGTLNVDPMAGSATHPTIAIYGGKPVVTWGEVNLGSTRQVYAKQWSGTDWVAPSATVIPGPNPPTVPAVIMMAAEPAPSSSGSK